MLGNGIVGWFPVHSICTQAHWHSVEISQQQNVRSHKEHHLRVCSRVLTLDCMSISQMLLDSTFMLGPAEIEHCKTIRGNIVDQSFLVDD